MNPDQYSAICRELLLTCRDLGATLHSQVAPVCRREGITLQQLYVLSELRENPDQRITQICERVGVQRTNFALLSKKLEAKGLVQRTQSPNDKRAYSLIITELGENTLDNVSACIESRFRDAFGDVSDDTVDAIVQGVRELRLGCGRLR